MCRRTGKESKRQRKHTVDGLSPQPPSTGGDLKTQPSRLQHESSVGAYVFAALGSRGYTAQRPPLATARSKSGRDQRIQRRSGSHETTEQGVVLNHFFRILSSQYC
jgi:hypothetical protein